MPVDKNKTFYFNSQMFESKVHCKTYGFCHATPLPTSISVMNNVNDICKRYTTPKQPPKCARIQATAHPPRRIGNVAKDLRQALQNSLKARTSRIDVRLPFGAKLGTEKRDDKNENIETQRTSGDRELGRLVSGMFEGTGLSICVAFSTETERAFAARMWGPLTKCETTVWSSTSLKKRAKKRKQPKPGFGASNSTQVIERGIEGNYDVYVTVGGGAGFMQRVKMMCESVGMDTLIIVANGNSMDDELPLDLKNYFEDEFENVYFYQPNPNPKWKGGVLFRKFPDGSFILFFFISCFSSLLTKVNNLTPFIIILSVI